MCQYKAEEKGALFFAQNPSDLYKSFFLSQFFFSGKKAAANTQEFPYLSPQIRLPRFPFPPPP